MFMPFSDILINKGISLWILSSEIEHIVDIIHSVMCGCDMLLEALQIEIDLELLLSADEAFRSFILLYTLLLLS